MAVKPDNPVVGGTSLARARINSPNFVTGVSGWTINQDGSAEFNNVTIRGGVIVGGTALYYSTSPPAANTMVASIAAASGTDSAGNAYFAGFTTYGKSGLTYYALNQLPGIDHSGTFGAVTTVYTAASQAGPWTAGSQLNLAGSNIAGLLADTLEVFGVTGAPTLRFSHGTNLAAIAAFVTATANGMLNVLNSAGLSGAVPLVQVDNSTHSVGNTGTAGDITKTWTIPANDGAATTSYVLKAFASLTMGQTSTQTLTIGADIDGTQTPLATLGASFNGSTTSATYDIPLELTVDVDAISLAVPQVSLTGPLGNTSANRLATNSANMSGHSNVTSWDKTVSHTLAIYAQWGGAGGSVQTIATSRSKLYREGP